jgi:hypothetical protein
MSRVLTLLKALGSRVAGFMPGSAGIVDELLQTFENCRAGLPDDRVRAGSSAVQAFFEEIYEKERPRLVESLRSQEVYLSEPARAELIERVDDRIRSVVVPAYARLAGPLTLRERNDFFVLPAPWHGAERAGWSVLGTLLGAFIVWAPFIPLWEKEWVLVFLVGGLFFPGLRRYFALKRYEGELNRLAARTEEEIGRLDLALMTSAAARRAQDDAGGAAEQRHAESASTSRQAASVSKQRAVNEER